MVEVGGVRNLYVLCCLSVLAACSNGRGSVDSEQPPPPSPPAQGAFSVSGTVAGLDGDGMVLQLNGANDLAVANNGTFTFSAQLADTTAYSVTVLTQPSGPSQTCTVGNGSGTIAAANVTNVTVTCATGAFALRGTVSGLAGTGLVLQNNGGDDLAISANGKFSFPSPIASGATYSVTVKTQPTSPSQSCTVTNGTGTIGSADVTNVAVKCATGRFTIGGTVTGLQGSGLVLRNNGGDDLTITGNGPFQFPSALASGAVYNVTVRTNPSNPAQSCAVTNASGTVGNASVANITVDCMTNRFTIGGSISGLAGSGLQLRLNNLPPLSVPAGATSFTFPSLIPSGASYVVDVAANPTDPAQDCTVAAATRTGTVAGANVTNVSVTCATKSFRIGGSVSGLQGQGLVLRKNDGETLAIASSGEFFFSNRQPSGTQYEVIVQAPPSNPSQNCTIANGSGRVGNGDVRSVRVSCSVNNFSVGGTVSGLLGKGLELQNNGGDKLKVNADGAFTFKQQLASGSDYNVQVSAQPSDPTQVCSVVEGTGSGKVVDANITSVAITCTTADFAVGGTVTGLVGTGLRLQNNGGDDLDVIASGPFTFATGVPSGATYNVTVVGQPTGPAQQCDPVAGTNTGTVGGENVTSVQINCVTTEFSIGGTVTGLTGGGLQLQNIVNGEIFNVAAPGPFKFLTSLPNGSHYEVIVLTQPNTPTQSCLATNNVGDINGADVTTIQVDCVDSP
jgi:large repetitive protein